MRAFGITTVLVLFCVWALWSRYHYVCNLNNLCQEQVETPVDDGRAKTLSLVSDGKQALSGYEQFAFNGLNPELSEDNSKFLTDLTKFMKDNPDHKLKITGYYLPGEEGEGSLENAGLVRADRVRQLLVKNGIDASRIGIGAEMLNEGDTLDTPVRFNASGPKGANEGKKDEEEFAERNYTFEDMTFNDITFDKGSAKFEPNAAFNNHAQKIAEALKTAEYKGKKVHIIGHTDTDGTTSSNQELGRLRARSVRNYLNKNFKISKSNMSYSSKGETEPVAPNDTETNMRKNRRVNLQIK